MRKRVFEVLEFSDATGIVSRTVAGLIVTLISLNVIAVILGTVEALAAQYATYFKYFEIISIVAFSGEYVLRIWACTSNPNYNHPVYGRLRYSITPMALVDLFAILPFYLPHFVTLDLRFLRALRLFRLSRLLKLARYSMAMKMIAVVLRKKREELLISAFVVSILLILSSSLMYYVEHEAQPDVFTSIPTTMWWAVITLTTVGYGDVFPVTLMGKFLGGVIALLGIGIFALPTGILASGFTEELRERIKLNCPHCGKPLNPPQA